MDWKIEKCDKGLNGELVPPADKSISHRAVMFGSIADGKCRVDNFLFSEDCLCTLRAFRAMGVDIAQENNSSLIVNGVGLKGLTPPGEGLYFGNSGTSMRIISGIMAGQDFESKLSGDVSLSRRPMKRIIEPLQRMGVKIESSGGGFPPLKIMPSSGALKAIDYVNPVASAQVKSCVVSAGLYADGKTSLSEPYQSRDHTERMLEHFSAEIERNGLKTTIIGGKHLRSKDIQIPGDISSAAFFIVGALILEGSELRIKGVGINPTRDGIVRVLKRMGASIDVHNFQEGVEPVCDLKVSYSRLKGTTVNEAELPLLIDEVPVLIIAALKAEGQTIIKGIPELKVKETDRIRSMTLNLARLGTKIREKNNDLLIEGGNERFRVQELDSFGDHRIAMSMAIAALCADGTSSILNTDCVQTSYPYFLEDLGKITA